MDVRMPDGTIVSNVPDNITQTELLARYKKFKDQSEPVEEAGLLRDVADTGVSLAQGVVGMPEALVGLADIPTGGRVGKFAEEYLGYRPKEAKEFLQQFKSQEQQEAEKYVGEAEGFLPTIGRALERPGVIAGTVAESLPSMLGGAGIARGIVGKAATGAVGAIGPQIPKAATGLSPLVAGALGEGAISAGATAEQARQASETGLITPQQSAVSAVSGLLTSGFGLLGGKVASKYLDVADIDTLLAGGVDEAVKGSILTAAFKGALSESVFEELPQSMQEQIAANLNAGRDWDEGVAEAGAMGMLAALPMGGGAGMVSQYRANKFIDAEKTRTGAETDREAQEAADQTEAAREILGRELEVPDENIGIEPATDGAGAEVSGEPGATGVSAGTTTPDGATVAGAGADTGQSGVGEGGVGSALDAAPAAKPTLDEFLLSQEKLPSNPSQLKKLLVKNGYEAEATDLAAKKQLSKKLKDITLRQETLTREEARKARMAEGEAMLEEIKKKRAMEAELEAKRQEFEAGAADRLAAMDEAERTRLDTIYSTDFQDRVEPDENTLAVYEEERSAGESKDEQLPAWDELTPYQQAYYNFTNTTQGLDAAQRGLRNIVGEGALVGPGAYYYEANREQAQQELKTELPAWSELDNESKMAFLRNVPSQPQSGAQVANAFKDVAETVQAKPFTQLDTETKVQEKSSKFTAQKDMQVEAAINNGAAWQDVLDIITQPDRLSRTPNAPRIVTADSRIAARLKDLLSRTGNDINIQFGIPVAESDFGKAGKFDPDTNTLTIFKQGAIVKGERITTDTLASPQRLSEVVLHEVTHATIDHLLDNQNRLNPKQKAAIKELDDLRQILRNYRPDQESPALGQEYPDAFTSLKEFVAEAMSNAAFQKALGDIKPEGKIDKFTTPSRAALINHMKGVKDAFTAFVNHVAELLGFNKNEAKVLKQIISQIDTLTGEGYEGPREGFRGQGVSYATAAGAAPAAAPTIKAPPMPQRSVEQMQDNAENITPAPPKSLWQREMTWLLTQKARQWAFKEFQNERYPLKTWQAAVKNAGKLIVGEQGFNNIYDFVTLAFGRAQKLSNEFIQQPAKQLSDAVEKYVNATGKSTRRALAEIGLYAEALHEAERRQIKYLKLVPMSITKTVTNPINGKTEPAASVRNAIFNEIESNTNLTDAEITNLRQQLEQIVAANKEAAGASFEGTAGSKMSLDINDNAYRVCHLTAKDAALIRQHYANSPNKAAVDEVLAAMKPMTDATVELNRRAGYWTKQVDNVAKFYNFKNYVPYKGRPNTNVPNDDKVSFYDPNTVMLSTELKQTTGGFEGRTTESQNPILQVLADGTAAAARAGRGIDYTQAIKNAIDQKLIKGEKVKTLTFADRRRISDEDQALINQRNSILHYNEDGSIDILRIAKENEELLEAIRRPYKSEAGFLTTELNKLTSFFGQMHTRYNPSFPLIGFTRDVLTNSFIMMAEGNPKMAAQFAGAAAKDVFKLGKANKIMRMYHSGNFAEAEKYVKAQEAKGDTFARDMLEYIEQGGRVSYAQSLSVRSAINELHSQVGRNGILQTKDQIEKVFDIWTDMFEITARTAAYSLMRDNMVAKGMTPEAARVAAASHVKQFANFEEVGRLGKELGAMFMFFRPSATGAVRSIEAIEPAFRSWENVKRQLPENIFGTELERTLSNVKKPSPEQLARAAELNQRVENYRKEFEQRQKVARTTIMGLTAAGATVWLMAAMMAGDDDEDRNKILTDDMARWTRFARFDLGGEEMLQIPWGFGLGAFPAIGAQVASMFNSYSSSPMDLLGNFTNIFLDNFLPLPVSRMNPMDNFTAWFMDSITPSAVRPLYEYTMNVNSFGQEIYNNRQSRVSDAYIGGDNIPELYKLAARNLFDITDGAVSWSPNTMYFLMNNYLDGVSRMAHNGYGMALTLSGDKDFDPKRDVPLVESFLSKKSNIDNREYEDLRKTIDDYRQRLTTMQERNPDAYIDFIDRNPHIPAMIEVFDSMTGGVLNSLREQANVIRYQTPDWSIKERKEYLDENKLAQSFIKRNIIDTVRSIEEDY